MESSKVRKYLSIILGTGILSFGMFNVHSRCAISEGGVLGLSLLLFNWFNISPGVSSFIMDSSAMLIGAAIMKSGFLWDSLIAASSYSLWYFTWERVGYVLPNLADYDLAAAIVGGVLVGVGAGLVVRHDCAAGGDDSLALVFNKLTGQKVALFYVMSDFTVLALSLTYIPVREIIWSMLSVLISSGIIELLRLKPNIEMETQANG